jgi:hypothetical protein
VTLIAKISSGMAASFATAASKQNTHAVTPVDETKRNIELNEDLHFSKERFDPPTLSPDRMKKA